MLITSIEKLLRCKRLQDILENKKCLLGAVFQLSSCIFFSFIVSLVWEYLSTLVKAKDVPNVLKSFQGKFKKI